MSSLCCFEMNSHWSSHLNHTCSCNCMFGYKHIAWCLARQVLKIIVSQIQLPRKVSSTHAIVALWLVEWSLTINFQKILRILDNTFAVQGLEWIPLALFLVLCEFRMYIVCDSSRVALSSFMVCVRETLTWKLLAPWVIILCRDKVIFKALDSVFPLLFFYQTVTEAGTLYVEAWQPTLCAGLLGWWKVYLLARSSGLARGCPRVVTVLLKPLFMIHLTSHCLQCILSSCRVSFPFVARFRCVWCSPWGSSRSS